MDPDLDSYIKSAAENGSRLPDIRSSLVSAGWDPEAVDAGIRRFSGGGSPVAGQPAPTAPARMPPEAAEASRPIRETADAADVKPRRGPGCLPLIIAALALAAGSIMTHGGLSVILGAGIGVLFWFWVIFWGGDAWLEGSFFMSLLAFFPGANRWGRDGIRVFAWVSLILVIGSGIYRSSAVLSDNWNALIWPDDQTRIGMGANVAYYYDKPVFETEKACTDWVASQLLSRPGAVGGCAKNCAKKGIIYECADSSSVIR